MKTQLSKPARHNARYIKNTNKKRSSWRNSAASAAKVAAELAFGHRYSYRWAHLEREPTLPRASSSLVAASKNLKRRSRRLRAENANFWSNGNF